MNKEENSLIKIENYINGRGKIKDRSGPNNTRYCNNCKEFISIELFGVDNSQVDKIKIICNSCCKIKDNIFKNDEYKLNTRIKKRNESDLLKQQVIEGYGGKCKCCGIKELEFLQIDHIWGGGTKERRVSDMALYGKSFYEFIITNDFPNKYQILCANCNISRGHYGICCGVDRLDHLINNNCNIKNIKKSINRWKYRLRLINKYGGNCACCGEDNKNFLVFDHVDRTGGEERRKMIIGDKLFKKLNDNIVDSIRILCYNCNTSLGLRDYCPHNLF